MGVVLTKHITDTGSRLFKGFVRGQAAFVHGVQDPAMYGLQAVTNVGKGTANDDAHGVLDIRAFHFIHQIGLGDGLVREPDIIRAIGAIMLSQFASPP